VLAAAAVWPRLFVAGPGLWLAGAAVAAHAAILVGVLDRTRRRLVDCRRIDGPMVLALSYIPGFALLPLAL
jgi:hypothetical protein